MNAIDTNVLIRIVVHDDEIQSRRALNYVKHQGEVFVSLIVLCESVWVLEDCYHLRKEELVHTLETILSTSQFMIESSDVAWMALRNYKNQPIEFSDCLIGALAQFYECKITATFDRKAAKTEYFELI
jgi:predicted nucleic-acid-binding protein